MGCWNSGDTLATPAAGLTRSARRPTPRWLVSHSGYSRLRRQVQIATMKRSDSTTRPSGISMRTGPSTSTGPDGTTRTVRRSLVLTAFHLLDHDQLLFARRPPADRRSPSTAPVSQDRTERDPCVRTTSAWMPRRPSIRIDSLRHRRIRTARSAGTPVGQQCRRRIAQRIEHHAPVGPGVPCPRRSRVERNLLALSVGPVGHTADCRPRGRRARTRVRRVHFPR